MRIRENHPQIPDFTLLPALAQYREGLLIKSPTAYEKVGKQDAQQHPVGTGPFKLAKWEQNNLIVLEKNKEYWKPGLPHLDRIEFKIMKDGVTRATALRAGEVDYVELAAARAWDRVAKESKIQVWTGRDPPPPSVPSTSRVSPLMINESGSHSQVWYRPSDPPKLPSWVMEDHNGVSYHQGQRV